MRTKMTDNKPNTAEKQAELAKYRDLVLATLDYYIDHKESQIQTADFDPLEHYKGLKIQTENNFQKGRLTKLKQWFHDLTEMYMDAGDLKFNKYLQDKTKHDIDILKSFFQRIDKIIEKEKIVTDKQFHDVNTMVDQLCQTEPVHNNKIEVLNSLLSEYELRKSRQTKKPIA
jgi:hypothetical protein